jgi:hypothetical protein
MSTPPEELYLPEIRTFELPEEEEKLLKLLGISNNSASPPAKHLLDLVLGKRRDAVPSATVVVENDYVDQCHQAAYARAYARSFRYFERNCQRIHFFSSQISKAMLVAGTKEELQEHYRGFCVLRNRPRCTLGRMVVSPPSGIFPFRTGFDVNLAGHALKAFGVPFLQRDDRVAACATSAVWMALSLMTSSLQSQSVSSLTDISDYALALKLGFDGRPVNRMRLETRQVEHAINRLGFNCTSYMAKQGARIQDLLCKYLDSGIAPILYLQLTPQRGRTGHAVTTVGYRYRPAEAREFKHADEPGFMPSSELVDRFLIHDDRLGAYLETNFRREQIDSDTRQEVPIEIAWDASCLTDVEHEHEKDMYSPRVWLRGLTVPLPPRVSLVAEKAEAKAWAIIKAASKMFKREELRDEALGSTKPVLRTYLVASNDYKERLNSRLGSLLVALYRGTHMPRYVWATEVRHFARGSTPDNSKLYGMVIIDSTSEADGEDFVALHVPGHFVRMSRKVTVRKGVLEKVLPSEGISIPDETGFQDRLLVFGGRGT